MLPLVAFVALVGVCLAQTELNPDQFCFDCKERRNHKDLYQNPNDCTSFIQCFYNTGTTGVVGFVRPCAPGFYFNEAVLTCTEDINGDCSDRCSSDNAPRCYANANQDACSFFDCANRRSHRRCCSPGTHYFAGNCSCVAAPAGAAACPCQEETGETVTPFAPTADVAAGTCTDGYGHLLATSTTPHAFDYIDNGVRKTIACPQGTSFLLVSAAGAPVCDCLFLDAANVRTQQKPACNLFLPFNSATGFTDMTVHNHWLDNLGLTKVTLATGGAAGTSQAASFNGAAHLEAPALKTHDFRGDISICFFARCAGAACQSGGILSNAASTNGGWSVRTAMSPDTTLNVDLATVFPQATASLTANVGAVNSFFHVCEVYGSDTFTLYVNGAEVASTPLTGDVAIKHCPFAIGADQRFGFFAGEIDEVLICDHVLVQADRALHQAANYAGMIAENMIRPCADNTLGCYA